MSDYLLRVLEAQDADAVRAALADAGEPDRSLQLAADARLAQLKLEREVETQAALARAAHSLHESLDLETVLAKICLEATEILGGDVAAVWRGNAIDGVRLEAVHRFPPEMIGYELSPGAGLAGRVIQSGKAMIASD